MGDTTVLVPVRHQKKQNERGRGGLPRPQLKRRTELSPDRRRRGDAKNNKFYVRIAKR